jgi:hypothetical protein
VVVGAVLLAAYLLQAALGLEWPWLAARQGERTFKLCTGALLLAYLAHQWWLAVGRANGWARAAKRSYRAHKLLGAAAPLFLYLHSLRVGYGYLVVLSTVFLANVGLGLVSPDLFRRKPKWFTVPWMITHVGLAVVLAALALFHLWIASSFE